MCHRNQTAAVYLRAEVEGYLLTSSHIRCADGPQEVDVRRMPLGG